MYAEKAPNARGVQRVLGAIGQMVLDADAFLSRVKEPDVRAIVATGNYRQDWARPEVLGAIDRRRDARFVVLIDTHGTAMVDHADVVLPGATWAEKAGRSRTPERCSRPSSRRSP
jgi:NADH-quinone oxidoreductase subunit G